jgi:eukaryotic-like serine/threonine-protein kinase
VADDLKKPFPENTIVQFSYLPTLRAQLAITRYDAIIAVSTLEVAGPYELGLAGGMYPAYVRGQAYLALRQGLEPRSGPGISEDP